MKRRFYALLALIILLQACAKPAAETPASTQPPAATDIPVGITEPVATNTPVDEPAAAAVEHVTIPFAGKSDRATAHDNDNASTFATRSVRSGDEFFRNRFERPFTANDMTYIPDVDIVNFSITSDDDFFYINLSFAGLNEGKDTLGGYYGVEIDRNADGRAELLITTRPPYSEKFTADNVQVYMDVNGDVGGSKINRPDNAPSDGFETLIFDLTQGIYPVDDPDFAWVRLFNEGSLPAVEIAYKRWIFSDGKSAFMWSADASASPLDPGMFYLQDRFSAQEAGAANVEDANYPVKALAEFDNTCRVSFGLNLLGLEPLGCYVQVAEKEVSAEPIAEGANSTCGVFSELCKRAGQ